MNAEGGIDDGAPSPRRLESGSFEAEGTPFDSVDVCADHVESTVHAAPRAVIATLPGDVSSSKSTCPS